MAQTPEGKVKDEIRKILDRFGAYYFMPVQSGYGQAGLDFHCHIVNKNGYAIAFYIEAKAAGNQPSARQINTINKLQATGATVFVITPANMGDLELFLVALTGK